jgi:hypothetical protein
MGDRRTANERRTLDEGAWTTAILFVIPQPEFCCVPCVPCAWSLTREGPLNRGFTRWRGGRVAEGGGLLNLAAPHCSVLA